MMQAIHIGIVGANPGWERILDQIGVSWVRMNSVQTVDPKKYSCVIIGREMSRDELSIISGYLNAGGSVIDTNGHLIRQNPVRRKLKTIFPDSENSVFRHIEHIRVDHHCLVHPYSDLLGGSVWFDPSPHRSLAFVGLPLNQFAGIQPLVHTQFKSSHLPAVAEGTAARSSDSYLEVILTVLKKLHAKSGVPLVHKWWMPDPDKQVATFRIDSDYGSKAAIESAAAPALENNVPITWFLHVEAHESWLSHFHRYPQHEIAIHCNRHSEFKTRQQYAADISRALRLLQAHGFNPSGYAAPYGVWSRELGEALADQAFLYSSEFGYDYDSLPSVSSASRILQLPIHPLSAGSFSRFRFTPEMITDYFDEIVRLKRLQHRPLHLYHHPNDGHEDILKSIFKSQNHETIGWLTYTDWATWWQMRSSSSFLPLYDSESKTVQVAGLSGIPVAIHKENDQFLVTQNEEIDLEVSRFSAYIDPNLVNLVNLRRNGNELSVIKLKKDQLMTRLWRNRV
ncbi:hypothetical protein BH23BAC3_BH23BAC3_09940 [soil metagenome]